MELNEQFPWYIGKQVDEDLFCQYFLQFHNLICVGGNFYDEMGLVTDENRIRQDIYNELRNCVRSGLAAKVESILASMRLAARKEVDLDSEEVIHVANGKVDLYEGFQPKMEVCRHRLPVKYTGSLKPSQIWEDFLNQLLEPEDILTLQEYMGYCLIPTNRAQRMLMILGHGGEGKSRIGVVMKAIFGKAMNISSLAKIEKSPFARADLEHLLVMVDDDMNMNALSSTNYIKSIISADLPMDVERKCVQSYQAQLHARFLAFGNGSLQALHDRSYGFFRRQIILTAKPRDEGRLDDPYLGQKLAADADQIFMWCLVGLYRLIENDFQFTISGKALDNWLNAVLTQNNVMDFLISDGYICRDPEGCITVRRLYELYCHWCGENALKPQGIRSFSSYLQSHTREYHIEYCAYLPTQGGKRARGYKGFREVTPFDILKTGETSVNSVNP